MRYVATGFIAAVLAGRDDVRGVVDTGPDVWGERVGGGCVERDVLDLLEERYTDRRSYELETRLREADIPHDFFSC